MGKIWLHDLPKWIKDWGLPVTTHPGWELRSRGSGGYEALRGIGTHHDASGARTSDAAAESWMWSATGGDQPIGAIRLRRSGVIVVGAAGATNTQGKGGPLVGSRGTIPLNDGNRYLVAIEAANDGVGEPWPRDQLTNYLELCACLCEHLDLDPARDIWGHAGYVAPSAPGRKIDPAGPTPAYPTLGGTTGARTWRDADFRALVIEALKPDPGPSLPTPGTNPTPSTGNPPPTDTEEDDDVSTMFRGIVKTPTGPYSAAWKNGTTTIIPSASLDEFRELLQSEGIARSDPRLLVKIVSDDMRRAYGPLVSVLPAWCDPYGVAKS